MYAGDETGKWGNRKLERPIRTDKGNWLGFKRKLRVQVFEPGGVIRGRRVAIWGEGALPILEFVANYGGI